MPELPEVETIRRDLVRPVSGLNIKSVQVNSPQQVKPAPAEFIKRITGLKILGLDRCAKLLIFKLSQKNYLLVHLKLTGQLIYREKSGQIKAVGGHPIKQDLQVLPNKFTRLVFGLSNGANLFFNDIRKFGYLKLMSEEPFQKVCGEYGVDPLSKGFTLERFSQILARRQRGRIKQVLMDQGIIAGVGNIYADESLFFAGILPKRRVASLTKEEIRKLWLVIPRVLKLSIAKRGTSADAYVDAYGREGGFIPYLKVYGREGEKCKRCAAPIKKIKMGGRGTHFCAKCQR